MVFEDRMLEKLLKLLKAINLQTKGGHQTLSIKQDTHTHTHTHTLLMSTYIFYKYTLYICVYINICVYSRYIP